MQNHFESTKNRSLLIVSNLNDHAVNTVVVIRAPESEEAEEFVQRKGGSHHMNRISSLSCVERLEVCNRVVDGLRSLSWLNVRPGAIAWLRFEGMYGGLRILKLLTFRIFRGMQNVLRNCFLVKKRRPIYVIEHFFGENTSFLRKTHQLFKSINPSLRDKFSAKDQGCIWKLLSPRSFDKNIILLLRFSLGVFGQYFSIERKEKRNDAGYVLLQIVELLMRKSPSVA